MGWRGGGGGGGGVYTEREREGDGERRREMVPTFSSDPKPTYSLNYTR